jgi:hypothetical protein
VLILLRNSFFNFAPLLRHCRCSVKVWDTAVSWHLPNTPVCLHRREEHRHNKEGRQGESSELGTGGPQNQKGLVFSDYCEFVGGEELAAPVSGICHEQVLSFDQNGELKVNSREMFLLGHAIVLRDLCTQLRAGNLQSSERRGDVIRQHFK